MNWVATAFESESLPVPIAMVGPMVSGKSDLGLVLAGQLGGEVVNVDSMQLYRGMGTGTAKLSVDQRRGIPYHQLDVLNVTQPVSVATYQREAVADVEAIRAWGKVPIPVGGSMMYVQALVDDWQFPPTDPEVHAKWEAVQDEIGPAALHDRLTEINPDAAAIIETNDPRHTVRTLKVIELTGKSFVVSKPSIDKPSRQNTRILGLRTQAEWLDPRTEQRTRGVFVAGLVKETERLTTQGLHEGVTASRAIGYAQVLGYLDGVYDLDTACERTITGTRRYVRRQRSWFNRDHRIGWLNAVGDVPGQAFSALGL